MAGELRPGVFEAIFTKLAAKTAASGAAALTSLALAIEREAKQSLAQHTHTYGTRTSASSGGPPALVSGTLRRSITHTRPATSAAGVEVRVGVGAGFYPPYPATGTRTSSSKYGYYLETGLRNGVKYPFLHPAFRKVVDSGDVGRFVAAEWRRS
jgi:hypothetical protein